MYASFWFVLMIVFLIVEACTVSMISVWFAIGSLAAMLVSLLQVPFWLQLLVMVVFSGVSLALLKPLARRYFSSKITPTNVDSVIGKKGLVTDEIDNILPSGQVKLDAMTWSARSTSGEKIPKDTLVRVDRIEGVKVFVSPVETNNTASQKS